MKKFLLLLLVLTVCLSAFIGCSDFDNKNTESDDEENFNAQNTEQVSNFPKGPPALSVTDGKTTIPAWRGTCSWMFENEGGTISGINSDSPHPLDCKDDIQAIKISDNTTLTLNFEASPTKITVKRYKLNASDYDTYDDITVTENKIKVKDKDYLYEVIAKWDTDSYGGTVYYAFRTEN